MNTNFPLKIMYYDAKNSSPEEVYTFYQLLSEKYNGEVIALPKQYELLCNCTLSQLEEIRDTINEAIKYKKQLEKRINE